MINSHAQTISLTCPQCGQTFTADAYIVVDIAERPDLLEKIRNGILHDIHCTHCAYHNLVDAPLLIYRPDQDPTLLFSPTPGTSRDDYQQQVGYLIERLKESLAFAWKDDWLKNGIQIVQRQILPDFLSAVYVTAQELIEGQTRHLELFKNENPERYLQAVLHVWLGIQDLNRKRQMLENNPELLNTQTDALLNKLLVKALENKDDKAKRLLQGHLNLLAFTRSAGMSVAFEYFEKQQGLQQNLPDGLQEILDKLDRPEIKHDMPRLMELYHQALQMISMETHSELWGLLHYNLAKSLTENSSEPSAEDIEQAIYHFEQALEVYTYKANSGFWAMTHGSLATTYIQRTRGERADNIEQVISHCRQALEVFTINASPELWAITENNLALAYWGRIQGDRGENIDQAIHHYQQVLKVRTHYANLEDWALVQKNLGIAFQNRIFGERADNIEQAINHFFQVLKVRTRQVFPQEWAQTQNNLALSYADRIRGERADNLEKSIKHYQLALEIYTRQTLPLEWAQIQNNLAIAYAQRIRGEFADNMEQAIHYYRQALQVFTIQTFSQDWAGTQNNLAIAYKNRIRGERAENVDQAIHHILEALKVFTRQAFPRDWADTQHSLASAYAVRIRGERADNIEQSIYHYQQALEVHTRQTYPERWALTLRNLGIAYSERIRGEREHNLEQAIGHYQQVLLEVYTRQSFREHWAMTQSNLGTAYFERIRGEREQNLEQAIQHYQQALEVYTRQAFPRDWAVIQNNLALVFVERIHGKRAENIEQAIYHCQQALEVRTREADPEHWAGTQNNLAGAYHKRVHGKRAENIEIAIKHSKQALEVFTRQAFPIDWAGTHRNLANAYSERIRGERDKNVGKAIYCYKQALEVFTIHAFPLQCCKTAYSLGDLAFAEHNWELSRSAYAEALVANDLLVQSSFTRSGKQAELLEIKGIHHLAAHVHIKLGDLERAVEILEQGRAQLLRESLERQRHDLEQLPNLGFVGLYEDYVRAVKQYDNLEILGRNHSVRPANWLSQVESALTKVQAAATAIRENIGQSYPQYRYFLQALPFATIQKLATKKPIVYLSFTSAGGFALLVTPQSVIAYDLPALNQANLQRKIWPLSDEEIERLNTHILHGNITLEDVQAARIGYLSMYHLWKIRPYLTKIPKDLKLRLHVAWQEALDETTHWLWDVAMGKLTDELKKHGKSITLIPTDYLALLPLHAAWHEDEIQPTKRRYVLDELEITYVPSAHALWQASLASERPAVSLLAVDNPDGTLFFTTDEVKYALEEFKQSKHLKGENAKVAVVKEEMQKFHVLHFSTHGVAGFWKTEQSRLKLADGYLTLPDIFELDLDQTRLAVLSACETGIPGLEVIEEVIGLPSGLMQAGVPGVIGSLWSVDDMSTAMLMARFYSLWRGEGQPPQEALRQAQIWLRDSTTAQKKEYFDTFIERQIPYLSKDTVRAFYPHVGWDDPNERVFASPFYWAAFTYTGV